MKRSTCALLALLLGVLLAGCEAAVPSAEYLERVRAERYSIIAPEEAKALLDAAASGAALAGDVRLSGNLSAACPQDGPPTPPPEAAPLRAALVDVRTAEEYAAGHIPGAILLPQEEIGDAPPEVLPDFDTPLIVYCRSGRRSKAAAEQLIALGYRDVRDLGGIESWPYETIASPEPGAWGGAEAVQAGVLSRFSTTALDGSALNESMLSEYRLTMVNVWATFCGPCLKEMPVLGELADAYAAEGVQIVGLVSDVLDSDGSLSESQLETARALVAATEAHYPHLLPSEDLSGLLSQIVTVPTTFFVDAAGKQVGEVYVGARSRMAWESAIEHALEEVS